jgi:flagellar hook-associated protein 2
MSGSFALGGVLTGIDYDALIENSILPYYRPLARANDDVKEYEAMKAAVKKIQGSFSTFNNTLAGLSGVSDLRKVNSSSTDTNVVNVSATGEASEGSHSITVNQLATAQQIVHDTGLANLYSQVGNGGSASTSTNTNTVADASASWFTVGSEDATYQFQVDGENAFSVTFEADTAYSMNQVASMINDQAGYTAATVTGSGPYSLEFRSKSFTDDVLTITHTEGGTVSEIDETQWTDNLDGADPSAGVFSYSYNGTTRNIATSATTTLAELRDMINKDGSNPGVTASIIQHNDAYHLVLAGKNTGSDYQITIDSTETTIDTFDNDASQWIETQAAQNAQFRVDGYPTEASGEWMSSSSNTITTAIPGVTLSLTGTGSANISLNRNDSALVTKVRSMVDNYNSLYATIDLYTGYDNGAESAGVLQGDSTISSLINPIRNIMTSALTGFTSSSDGHVLATEIGIEIDRDGYLKFDETVFNEALEDNYEQVVQFLAAEQRGVASSNRFQYSSSLDSTEVGIYEVKAEFTGTTLSAGYIRLKGETTWRAAEIDAENNTITGASGNDEAGLEVIVSYGGNATETTELRLQNGLATAAEIEVKKILDKSDGAIQLAQESYDRSMDNLDDEIDRIQDRIDHKREILNRKFARLEAAMAVLEGQTSQFDALFSSLDINKANASK